MRSVYIILVILFFPLFLLAQPTKLAQQYFQNGEFEKAASLYQKLFHQNENNDYYFNKYIDCLLALEQFDECEKILKKQIKKNPRKAQLYVTYGNLFERQYRDDEAKLQYERAIKKVQADRFLITKLANAFITLTKYDFAIKTYERGAELLKDKNIFAYNLGDLYRRKGDNAKMIDSYLHALDDNPSRLNSLETLFQRFLFEEDYAELQTQLYDRIQADEDAVHYVEMLTWLFIQKKNYKSALRQVKALDRKLKENGGRVYRLAEIAANDKDYDTAISAYEYIVEKKGPTSSYYVEAKRASLNNKRKKIVEGFDYTTEDLKALEAEYESFLNEFGRNKTTASIISELADLEAFYLNNLDKAITLLNEMINFPNVNKHIQARGKISLADFYLANGEIWEATLLYSQVDKEYKDDLLGQEARFRNAKLSYYTGDFQWAQAQFDVLKASTSKLIANDALDLSIFIMDNLGLDTTNRSLQLYAEADLLVFQNKFDDAFLKLDSLAREFPKHSLQDDILYTKSKIYFKKRDYKKAAEMLQKIVDEHIGEIRADNALFELAEMNEKQFNNPEKAKELYERIFTEFSGSTFAIDARKRFRKLRGDDVQ